MCQLTCGSAGFLAGKSGVVRPLLALVVDEDRLGARIAWEPAGQGPPPGVPEGTLFPHVFGPLERDAVTRVLRVAFDGDDGPATGLH